MHRSNYLCVWPPPRNPPTKSPCLPLPHSLPANPRFGWIMDLHHHSNSWRVKKPAQKKKFSVQPRLRAYPRMCIRVSDEILPCAWYTHFLEKTFFNDLILPPPIQLIVRRLHWSLIISLFQLSLPLSSLLINPLQIDSVISLMPYRRCVWPMCWCYGGAAQNEMQEKENKETARSTDTELWSVMEDDIIVSGQSCSHRSRTDSPSHYLVYMTYM